MRANASRLKLAAPWAAYVPDEAMPWDLRRAVHLHRRAGFAATWDEIQRDLNDGPDYPTPAVSNGRIYIRGKSYLWCIGKK